MKRVPYQNTGKTIEHIGDKMIMPGQTREVDEMALIAHKGKPEPSAPENDAPDEPTDLLELKADELIANLPALTDDELNTVEAGEENGKKRKGVLKAIAEERLNRASAGTEMQAFIESLPETSDKELAEQLAIYESGEDDSEAYIAAIKAEQEKRAAA